MTVKLEDELISRFRCGRCESREASAKRVASTGTGISRLFDWHHVEFIAVWCKKCGHTQFFKPEPLEGSEPIF